MAHPPADFVGLQPGDASKIQALVSGAGIAPTLGDISAAAANLTTVNAAIAALSVSGGGALRLLGSGVMYINGRIIGESNVTLDAGGIEIKLTGGTNSNLLVTRAYVSMTGGAMIPLTLTWTAGRAVSATRTDGRPHGLAVGDYIAQFSDTLAPSNFKGTFVVSAITDSLNFVFRLHRTPRTGPTGTAQFTKATVNFNVIGGLWNQDYPNNTGGVGFSNQHAIIIGGAAHSRVIRPRFKNVSKFCLQFGCVFDYGWDGVVADGTNSDIVKVYGPAVDVKGYGISGRNGDDILSIQTKEPPAYADYMWTFGDCHGGIVEGIHAQSLQGSVFCAYFTENEYWGDITVRNVDGANSYGACLTGTENNSKLESITIERSRPACTIDVFVSDYGGTTTGSVVNNLRIVNPEYESANHALNPQAAGLYGSANISVTNLVMVNPNLNDTAYPSIFAYWGQMLGPVKNFTIENGVFNGSGSLANLLLFSGTVEVFNLNKTYVGSGIASIARFGSGTPEINITDSNLNSTGVVSAFAACDVYLSGNRINVGSNGVVRSNVAAAINVRSAGNRWVAGAAITNGSAAATWGLYGFDLAVDAGLSGVAKANGAFFMNTGSGRGALVQNRLVTGNGTVLTQVDTPANTY